MASTYGVMAFCLMFLLAFISGILFLRSIPSLLFYCSAVNACPIASPAFGGLPFLGDVELSVGFEFPQRIGKAE
ncbi:hypothetical protein AB0I98_35545 [Streptomyces sp. NPDC050211]|uniref:hypothetical protein n=1 Tax=Streptomyces sp. NPDC050211 TaxID=3154932 RepID=UPI003414A96F